MIFNGDPQQPLKGSGSSDSQIFFIFNFLLLFIRPLHPYLRTGGSLSPLSPYRLTPTDNEVVVNKSKY